jgi:hypothetical protein
MVDSLTMIVAKMMAKGKSDEMDIKFAFNLV